MELCARICPLVQVDTNKVFLPKSKDLPYPEEDTQTNKQTLYFVGLGNDLPKY